MKQTLQKIALLWLIFVISIGCTVESASDPSLPIQTADTPGGIADDEKPVIGYVTNGIASFWTVAEAGAKAGGRDFNADVRVLMPPDGAGDQKRMLEDLINQNVDGVAVSPINSENQADILTQVSQATNMITQDSDAPNVPRLAYIGMDNYLAGRMCGQLVKEALPDGGSVMIFVGRLGQLNADLRRQGVIDELLDRSHDSSRHDPTGQELKGDKYTVLDTRTDNFDFGQAKAQAEDAIVRYPDLNCMVGLFAYNPPNILEALTGANKLGEIKVVAFDEAVETLQAIKDGTCVGTVVQDPYSYGYKSVELLAKLARGDRSMLPTTADKTIDIPARTIRKDNVDEFWKKLDELTGETSYPGS